MIHERRKERKRNNGTSIKELIDEMYSISIDNEEEEVFQAIKYCFFKVRFAILKFKKNRSFLLNTVKMTEVCW